MTARRIGWIALAGFAGISFVTTALGGAWSTGTALRDDRAFDALLAAGSTVAFLAFWRWIALGAWQRSRPVDPAIGGARPERMGPWGVVGVILLLAIVVGFGGLSVWAGIEEGRDDAAAEEVRDRAERAVRRAGTTAEDVRRADAAAVAWAGSDGRGPYDDLLSVPGAEVVDVSVFDGNAAILLRPDRGPCVVVTIDADRLVRSRIYGDCSVIRLS
ncbi:MAG TPA: hypothetical protein VHK88_04895 [Aquihabitans sp.]|nr:hypothetical protein [Aquihabitans sp.]